MNGTSGSGTLTATDGWQGSSALASRLPFFYGWVMLPIAMLGQIATSPGQTFGISVFNESFTESLQLTATQLTGAYMLGSFLACFAVPVVGWLMDHQGIRRTMTGVVILLGGACIFTSQVRGLVSLFFAFLLLRMFGQGALSLLTSNTLAMWFHRRLGTVSGIMSLGMASAFATLPALFLALIQQVGWRWTYALLGVAVWLLTLPLLATAFRNRPEEVGQLPDGDPMPIDDFASKESDSMAVWQDNFTLGQALATRAYWIMTCMNGVWGMVATGIVFNIVPLFESQGLTAAHAAAMFSTFAVSMAVMQLVGGILADRLPLNGLLAGSFAGMTCGMWLLLQADSVEAVHGFAVLFGGAQGLFGAVGHTVWARYFGRVHLGKIRGSVWTATVAGSSLGPFAMGSLFDLFGSYLLSLQLFMLLCGGLAVAALLATRPQPPGEPEAA